MSGKTFTVSDLLAFTGKDGSPIYVSLSGKVFDVTEKGKSFYGPGGPYASLAGHDASRALACMAMDAVKDEPDDLSDLTPQQRESLAGWEKQFVAKYEQVGTLTK